MNSLPQEIKNIIANYTSISCLFISREFYGLSVNNLHLDIDLYRFVGYKSILCAIKSNNIKLLDNSLNVVYPSGKQFKITKLLTRKVLNAAGLYANKDMIEYLCLHLNVKSYGREMLNRLCVRGELESVKVVTNKLDELVQSYFVSRPPASRICDYIDGGRSYSVSLLDSLNISIRKSKGDIVTYLIVFAVGRNILYKFLNSRSLIGTVFKHADMELFKYLLDIILSHTKSHDPIGIIDWLIGRDYSPQKIKYFLGNKDVVTEVEKINYDCSGWFNKGLVEYYRKHK